MATLFQVRFTKAELDRLGCTHSELLEEGCRACHVSAALRRSFIVDELPDYPDLLEAPDDWYGIRWWTDWNPPGRRIVEGRYPDGDTAAKGRTHRAARSRPGPSSGGGTCTAGRPGLQMTSAVRPDQDTARRSALPNKEGTQDMVHTIEVRGQ